MLPNLGMCARMLWSSRFRQPAERFFVVDIEAPKCREEIAGGAFHGLTAVGRKLEVNVKQFHWIGLQRARSERVSLNKDLSVIGQRLNRAVGSRTEKIRVNPRLTYSPGYIRLFPLG